MLAFLPSDFGSDPRQKTRLAGKGLGCQTGLFTSRNERGEVHVGGDVLLARKGENVLCRVVLMIPAESPLPSLRNKQLLSAKTIINCEQFAFADELRRGPPP